jgi:hypothetical protein
VDRILGLHDVDLSLDHNNHQAGHHVLSDHIDNSRHYHNDDQAHHDDIEHNDHDQFDND